MNGNNPIYIFYYNATQLKQSIYYHSQSIRSTHQIPHTIFQSWSDLVDEHATPLLYNAIQSWSIHNPSYQHYVFTDTAVVQYVDQYLHDQHGDKLYEHRYDIIESYHKLQLNVQQIDLWRLLIIYEYGGIYADIDTQCNDSIDQWGINSDSTMISGLGVRGDLHQWLLVYIPHHTLIYDTILNVIDNILNNDLNYINSNVEAISGPTVLQYTYEQLLHNTENNDLLLHMQLLPGDYMNGHVTFKVNGIDSELHSLGHTHWIDIQNTYKFYNNLMFASIAVMTLLCSLILLYRNRDKLKILRNHVR